MASQDFKRKLAAILSADVQGYSLLMRDDEEATIRTLTTYRKAITNLIQQYRGRLVDATGDNLLSEFTSVVDAVNCAVEIQRELAERNAELSENRRMQFRIGINLGDVVEEGERIYGDGVNIAARMESLAEGGGICISGTVYDAIESKIGLEYEYLGEQEVKNIPKPIRAYRVLSYPGAAAHRVIKAKKAVGKTWRNIVVAVAAILVVGAAVAIWNFYLRPTPFVELASVEKMAYPLPDKPSIAVLPFVNMSGDSEQEYFSDGLTDQIINGLSKVPHLFVIARNSTFTYKGKPVKVQKVAEDLGVKYVLEGSVQKTVDRIRITAQLIDATTGHHLWSERYDRNLKDIFAIQDDITMEIMKAMQIKLTRGEQARLWAKQETTNLPAYLKGQEGRAHMLRITKEDVVRGRQLFEEAIALDPKFASAYAFLGWTHFFDARFGWTESRGESIKMAFECAQKALEMDDTLDYSHALLSAVYLVKRHHEKAITEAELALDLNPNGALVHNTMAGVLGCSGRWEESIIYGKKSIRLNPFPPPNSFHWLGRAYFMTEQYDEAIQTFKKALDVSPNYLPAHAFLAASYSSLDRETEAAAAAEEVLKINPKFSLEFYAKTLPYKNKADVKRYVAALRKAGLK
jgi:TolB-like protein/class 3 adenylate cyclase